MSEIPLQISVVFNQVCQLTDGKIGNSLLQCPTSRLVHQCPNGPALQLILQEYGQRLDETWLRARVNTVLPSGILIAILLYAINDSLRSKEPISLFMLGMILSSLLSFILSKGLAYLSPKRDIDAISALSKHLFLNEASRRRYTLYQRSYVSEDAWLQLLNSARGIQAFKEYPFQYETECMLRALLALSDGVFDCVAASGLAMLMLIYANIDCTVERVYTDPYSGSLSAAVPHSFLVINRDFDTDLRDMQSWNKDAMIFDPWYHVLIRCEDARQQTDFFRLYPLLNLDDKVSMPSFSSCGDAANNLLKSLNNEHAASLGDDDGVTDADQAFLLADPVRRLFGEFVVKLNELSNNSTSSRYSPSIP